MMSIPTNFLIIALCNSSANFRVRSEAFATQGKSEGRWFCLVSLLIEGLFTRVTAPPEGFLSKTF